MTSEWDDTPWAGESVKALIVPERPALKAVFGGSVYNTGPLLESVSQEPQRKARQLLQAYKCGWFYKAESKISGDLSRQPWTVSDGDIDSEDPDETTIPRPDLDIPFERLDPIQQFMRLMEAPVRDPNTGRTLVTGRQLRQKTFIRRDMAGWTFWYLETSGPIAPITAIYGISPSRLWPSYAKDGTLLGWVLDFDKNGGTMTFEPYEIVPFSNATPDDDDIYGIGVVEAVYAELPLTDLMTKHTADMLTTGGRLAGMMWPRERALDEDEFNDAQRAWRNVVSDPNSARRMLLFPEPMEYAAGASTPAEIGIPELAELNRDNILTAFPIAPEILGVPMPGGMNASGETRRELYDFYWEGTIQPRSQSYDEVIQVHILSRYEAMMGRTFRFETELPDLDDANSLLEKAGAFKSLTALGFDEKATIKAVGLDHIKWNGKPEPVVPPQLPGQPAEEETPLTATVTDDTSGSTSVTQVVGKFAKSRESVTDTNDPKIKEFLDDQRARVEGAWRDSYPKAKSKRGDWAMKAVEWWDKAAEDRLLKETLSVLYVQAARGSLQVVADTLDRIVPNRAVRNVVADLETYGGERIVGINEHTLEAVQANLAEGTRRGYSLNQLIEGVPDEQYTGLRELPVFDDARAEVIARTETMLSYNRAALDAYGEFGVSEVLAYDGDEDPECAARDGQTFTIEEALAIEDHPNGTLDWAPVTDKAWGGQPVPHAVKVDVGSPIVNVHLPENVVHVPEPVAPIVNVTTEPPVITVTPEVHPTPVNVMPAVVKVPAPVVNVAAAETPEVHVEVKAETPDVNVTFNPEMRITSMPDRVTRRKVERDKRGAIVQTTDVETDA